MAEFPYSTRITLLLLPKKTIIIISYCCYEFGIACGVITMPQVNLAITGV